MPALPEPICIDFETLPIGQRPNYPPEPVGCAFGFPGKEPFYMGFDHPTGNNCKKSDVQEVLHAAWFCGAPLLFHHAKFDLAVAYEKLGLPVLPWDRIHDTMFLAYLADPHARSLGLKELADDLLAWPATERDALAGWVIDHKDALYGAYGQQLGLKRPTPKKTGAWIFATPGALCGEYACGDVARTRALFRHLWQIVQDNGMGAAYDRERQLMPILMDNERDGMRVDLERLGVDGARFDADFETAENWLRRELRASGLNFDADADVAAVLLERGIVPRELWTLTESGALSMSKETLLPEMFTGSNGAQIASALGYRNRLKTCLTMFMRPWYEQASQYGGRITTNWNQTRGDRGGTRTGRPSTDKHNFLNISKKWDGRDDGYRHPDFLVVTPLPLVRGYVLPDEGHVWLHRDVNQQEMRIFAHVEQGDLWEQYAADAMTNPHAFVGAEFMRVAGREIDSTKVKVLNFQGLYGGGVPALQNKLRCSTAEAKELKAFHDKALPGRRIVSDEIKKLLKRGLPMRTLGGRLYFCERPGKDGRSKDYKMLNYYCQGGAADMTKQTIIDWYAAGPRSRFLISVYDENNISCPVDYAVEEMALLKEATDRPRLGLTVPIRSSPKHGATWGDAKKCSPEKGCPLCA